MLSIGKSKAVTTGEDDKFYFSFDIKKWGVYFSVISICWAPYLIICYPAVTRGFDFFWQLLQGTGIFPMSNHHPIFSSYVFGALFSIGNKIGGAEAGLFFIMIVQFIVMTGAISFCLTCLSFFNVNKIVIRGICAIISICPVFPSHAIWLIKDSFFTAISIILFFQVFLHVWFVSNRSKPPKIASLPAIVFMCLLFSLYRNGMSIIALVMLVVISWVCLQNNRNGKKYACSVLAFLIMIVSWNGLISYMDVYPTNVRESLSMPMRQIMRSIQMEPDDLSKKEEGVLKGIYKDDPQVDDIMAIVNRYQDFSADPIKTSYIYDNDLLISLVKLWFKRGLRHPGSYLDAAIRGTYGYWWLQIRPEMKAISTETTGAEDDFANEEMTDLPLERIFVPTVKSLEKNGVDTKKTFRLLQIEYPLLKEIMTVKTAFPKARNKLNKYIDALKSMPIISLFFAPGFYFWVLVFSLGYLFSRKREGRFLWPIVLMVAFACISPVNGYTRYVLPIELLSLIMAGICFIPERLTFSNRTESDGKE